MTNDHSTGLNAALAAELRAEKAAQGLTNGDISGRSGMTEQTVRRLLATERGLNVEYLERFAEAFGKSPAELIMRATTRQREAERPPGETRSRSAG